MKTKLLGKTYLPNKISGKKILDRIIRKESISKVGHDIWNNYDFLYLNQSGVPFLSIIEIIIPSDSKYIIESKSMKLYLNQFYKKNFSTKYDVIKKIRKDIETTIHSKVKIRFIKTFAEIPESININSTKLINIKPKKIIEFSGFRSICPVTSQPDFANIYIFSDHKINVKWLKDYLISFSELGEFHEQCISDIYIHLFNKLKPNHLEVCGRFQRRGGIDINPFRGTDKKFLHKNFRILNQ